MLASKSPRREELLMLTGWRFTVLASTVDEKVIAGEDPEEYVQRVSLDKAQTAQELLTKEMLFEKFILSCDTAVVSDEEILGKPVDYDDAILMLTRLRGRVHQVYSTLTVINRANGLFYQETCIADVPMRSYDMAEILEYVISGDPMDKAGAYAIQNQRFHPVENFKGCYANVMGLPLCHLIRLMENFGINPEVDIPTACQTYLEYDCPITQKVLAREI